MTTDRIRSARQGLLDYAESGAHTVKRGVIGSLFPAIFEAAKKMSTRAISQWLRETHNVKVSPAGISKALRHPDKYWQEYWELIEPAARTFERAHGAAMESFLFDDAVYEHFSGPEFHFEDAGDEDTYGEARATLEADWFSLDASLRNHMWKFVPKVEKKTAKSGKSHERKDS